MFTRLDRLGHMSRPGMKQVASGRQTGAMSTADLSFAGSARRPPVMACAQGKEGRQSFPDSGPLALHIVQFGSMPFPGRRSRLVPLLATGGAGFVGTATWIDWAEVPGDLLPCQASLCSRLWAEWESGWLLTVLDTRLFSGPMLGHPLRF